MRIVKTDEAVSATGLMKPSMNTSFPPPFYELDAIAFQELCRDLFERENGIKVCEVYGTPGQGQRGIDLKAQVRGGYAEDMRCLSRCAPACDESVPPFVASYKGCMSHVSSLEVNE